MTFTDRAEDYAIEAVKTFGVDALRLSGPDEQVVKSEDKRDFRFGYLDAMDHLGSLICEMIRGWKHRALSADVKARRQAVARIKEFAAALVPDTRGRVAVSDFDVLFFYYREIFKLCHVQHTMRNAIKDRKYSGYADRVRQASTAFEIPIDTIRELWCLDKEFRPIARPETIKAMARRLTDRHFHTITQHTLSNIISRFP